MSLDSIDLFKVSLNSFYLSIINLLALKSVFLDKCSIVVSITLSASSKA